MSDDHEAITRAHQRLDDMGERVAGNSRELQIVHQRQADLEHRLTADIANMRQELKQDWKEALLPLTKQVSSIQKGVTQLFNHKSAMDATSKLTWKTLTLVGVYSAGIITLAIYITKGV